MGQPSQEPSHWFPSKVAEAMRKHIDATPAAAKIPVPDQGMAFQDFGEDSSDSGLESIFTG